MAEQEEEQDTTRTKVRVVYGGRRLSTKGKLIHAWFFDGEDSARAYDIKGSVVGGIYEVEAARVGTSIFPDTLRYTGERVDEERRLELAAEDAAIRTDHEGLLLERSHARTNELNELIKPLRELVNKQVGWARRAALISYITGSLRS